MKNLKYYSDKQNVYREYTGSNSIMRHELICIAIDDAKADLIKDCLNQSSNGNTFEYKIVNGTFYHVETPEEVVRICEQSRQFDIKYKFYYGDVETGRDWCEENDTIGIVGRSTGRIKIPLLITSSRSKVFINKVYAKMGSDAAGKVLNQAGGDLSHLAAHDFFLTRNRHGAGFWDKEDIYGEDEAKILTDISHEMKETFCCHVNGNKSKLTFY